MVFTWELYRRLLLAKRFCNNGNSDIRIFTLTSKGESMKKRTLCVFGSTVWVIGGFFTDNFNYLTLVAIISTAYLIASVFVKDEK